jgi:hypothetical protein
MLMMTTRDSSADHRPFCGHANQSHQEAAFLSVWNEPLRVARKGRLWILSNAGVPEAAFTALYHHYYTDASYDILPTLRAAIRAAIAAFPMLGEAFLSAVVIQGLEMYAVGTVAGVLTLVRYHEVKELRPQQSEMLPLAGVGPDHPPLTLTSTLRRLNAGDTLVITSRAAQRRLSPRAMRHAAQSGSLTAVAHSLARAGSSGGSKPPVSVVRIPGFSPVPELGPTQPLKETRPPASPLRQHREPSPIWPALFFALVVVGVSFWFKKPNLSVDALAQVARWMLTPSATATITATLTIRPPLPTSTLRSTSPTALVVGAAPTATAAPAVAPASATPPAKTATPTPTLTRTPKAYPLPALLWPEKGAGISEAEIPLRWSWGGELAEDEFFDVRLWREGAPKRSIAWTRERSYIERTLNGGWHSWTVVVIRARNGALVSELSAEPEPLSFNVQRDGPAPPTAVPPPRH